LVVVQSQDASVRRHDTADIEDRLNGYVVQYHGRQIDRAGGATFQGVGYDFSSKAGISILAYAAVASAHPALSKRVPRSQDGGLRAMPVIEDQRPLVDAAVRSVWGGLAPRYFSLRTSTRPDLALKPNAVVEIVTTDNPNRESVVQGRYLILEVQHRYLDGAISTTAVAYPAADTVQTKDRFQGGGRTAPPNTVITAQVIQ
jgi:hypothetical protein